MKTWIVPIALALAGCTGHAPATSTASGSASLRGTTWRLVDPDAPATLSFPEEGKIAGNASCNRFFGSVKLAGDSIEVSGVGSTKMACPGPRMGQEQRYLESLQGANRYTVEGDTLSIWTKGSGTPLRFTRGEP